MSALYKKHARNADDEDAALEDELMSEIDDIAEVED